MCVCPLYVRLYFLWSKMTSHGHVHVVRASTMADLKQVINLTSNDVSTVSCHFHNPPLSYPFWELRKNSQIFLLDFIFAARFLVDYVFLDKFLQKVPLLSIVYDKSYVKMTQIRHLVLFVNFQILRQIRQ